MIKFATYILKEIHYPMKKYLSNSLISIILGLLCVTMLTSCNDDDDYYGSLFGGYELVSIDGYPVSEWDVVEYVFNQNGTGTYGQYQGGMWVTYPISWDFSYGNAGAVFLNIYLYNGKMWRYLFRDYGYQLELTEPSSGQRLLFDKYSN